MQVMAFALDAPTLALAADCWSRVTHETPVAGDGGVSLAAALKRSGARQADVLRAAKQERGATPALRRADVASRHVARLYTSKLLESDVQYILRRFRRGRWASKASAARRIATDLHATNLTVSPATILDVINGQAWQGIA